MFKVVHGFKDLKDNDYIYKKGDIYPRDEIKLEDVPKKRIKELSGTNNKIGKVLIEEIKEEVVEEEKATEEVVEEEKATEEVVEEEKTTEKEKEATTETEKTKNK